MLKPFFISAGLLFLSFSIQAQQTPVTPAVGTTEKLVKLYPNPAVSYVVFELKNTGRKDLSLQVYNGILGKKMIDTKLNLDRITLPLNEFTRGIYVYHLVEKSGKIVESGKFQVTK